MEGFGSRCFEIYWKLVLMMMQHQPTTFSCPETEGDHRPAPLKVVDVTDFPVPYRVPICELIDRDPRVDMTFVYCVLNDKFNRTDLPPISYKAQFLKPRLIPFRGRSVHIHFEVFGLLRRLRPDVVITDGFAPTYLIAFLYARLYGKKHVCETDGTYESEKSLSWLHRAVRRFVFRRSQAFVGASEGSRRLYRSYGIPEEKCFKHLLCVDNARFSAGEGREKSHDLMFCGRLIPLKSPLFVIDVAEALASRIGRTVSVLLVGTGELEGEIRRRSESVKNVRVILRGFASQADLPDLYSACRVFLFPTKGDVWGVVANEACAAGLPIITSPYAGSAGEIIIDGINGFVRELRVSEWADAVSLLLSDDRLYHAFSQNSRRLVSGYTYEVAAEGLVRAALCAAAG